MGTTRRNSAWRLLALGAAVLAGCSAEVDSTYGRVQGRSVNGTGVFAELLRSEGNAVRTAVRLTDELAGWADVIVRFAPYPGPVELEESKWYAAWLTQAGGRRLIYVPRDYDALAGYWDAVIDKLDKAGDRGLKARAEKQRDHVPGWSDRLPARPAAVADTQEWFAVVPSKGPPAVCKTLGGPWGSDLDAAAAALTRHETLKVDLETMLLEGDGKALAMDWSIANDSRVLVVANGSFLLNATLVNRARRPLALRTVRWIGAAPLRVAFVEGSYLLGPEPAQQSVFALLKIHPFGWVAAQLMVLGLAACLARAPRLGSPRPDPPSGEDRPVAHPEALGALLARTGQAADARAILDAYRRWRSPSHRVRTGQPSAAADPIVNPSQPESPEHE